jgi:hypothetical protein
MKKNRYIYFVSPLLGLIVFFGFYWNANKDYQDREEGKLRVVREEKVKRLKEEARNREKAVVEALAQQEKNKAAKKAREEKDAQEAEIRAQAVQARTKARADADKAEANVKRLLRDVEDEKKEIVKFAADKQNFVTEQAFLLEYVKKAEDNVRSLTANLERINEADKKWEEAAKAAAAEAAKKK